MSKSSRNVRKEWSPAEEKQLRILVRQNTPKIVIGIKLGRTQGAVQSKASDLRISLKPTNRSHNSRDRK